MLDKCSDKISIFSGDDKTAARDILLGFKGNISVTANICPLEMHNICKYASEGNENEAKVINKRFTGAHVSITKDTMTDTVIKEDDTEISRSFHRKTLDCVSSSYDGSSWTHTDTDISGESTEVQAICNAVWTTTVKNAKKAANEATGL